MLPDDKSRHPLLAAILSVSANFRRGFLKDAPVVPDSLSGGNEQWQSARSQAEPEKEREINGERGGSPGEGVRRRPCYLYADVKAATCATTVVRIGFYVCAVCLYV